MSAQKRKNELEEDNETKRVQTTLVTSGEEVDRMRPSTPPLGMTLCHYHAATGKTISTQLGIQDEIHSPICSGMTPVYKPSFERWGSCTL
ncbi:hypothetical protein INT47_003341 [Mucor saturninus]|uniref:Uncharacterized protein n=1 Tax=Mucor saturninus TaxID=64648 RepID=A0A8H7RFR9_9FUNG|nr:hypothetical protein INT47_003341 [Mucor saturninus]